MISLCAGVLSQMNVLWPLSPMTHDCRYHDGEKQCAILQIARTQAQKQRGLMGRTYLYPGQGMIFVRSDEQYRSFRMKNTLIPLHMIFLDAEKNVVDQTTMMPCEADPCTVYTSRQPAQYVIELMVRD